MPACPVGIDCCTTPELRPRDVRTTPPCCTRVALRFAAAPGSAPSAQRATPAFPAIHLPSTRPADDGNQCTGRFEPEANSSTTATLAGAHILPTDPTAH